MPRYFFHLLGETLSHDTEGTELHGHGQLHREAGRIARKIMAEAGETGIASNASFNVTDESGETVLTIRLSDALKYGE